MRVVLLPGLAVSRYLHRPRDLLSEHVPTVLVDYPLQGIPADVEAVRRRIEPGDVLVGHSYGTQIAARLAGPADAVVLVSPTIDPAYRSWPKLLARWWIDSRREHPDLARFQRPEQRRAGLRRAYRMTRSMLHDDIADSLRGLRIPVLVVRGSRDGLSTRAWAERLADRPYGRFHEVPGAPHAFPFDRPRDLCDVVLRAAVEGVRP